MTVVEPLGNDGRDLRAALEQLWIQTNSLEGTGNWKAIFVDGEPVIRALIGDLWWELRLKSTRWSDRRRAVYEAMTSGAARGELFFYPVPTDDPQRGHGSGRRTHLHSEIRCRLVVWLPRVQIVEDRGPEDARSAWPSGLDWGGHNVGELDIVDLRAAIRDNRVSFPSQVPTLARTRRRPGLQFKVALLYFVLGWNCSAIGERYRMTYRQVWKMLDTWKRRAADAGYIQYIPSEDDMMQPKITV